METLRRQADQNITTEVRARAVGRMGEEIGLRNETVREAVNTLQTAIVPAEDAGDPKLLTANQLRLAIAL